MQVAYRLKLRLQRRQHREAAVVELGDAFMVDKYSKAVRKALGISNAVADHFKAETIGAEICLAKSQPTEENVVLMMSFTRKVTYTTA
eukprot:m.169398 g.169398  ORF g.169398 m.169398 type:complete len:88 (-) comp16668_c0_seq19:150-413(-)